MGLDARIQVVHKDLQDGSEHLFIKVSEGKAKTATEYEIHIKSNDPSSLQVSRYDIENRHKTHPKTYKPQRAQRIYERFSTVVPQITPDILQENAIRIVSEKNHRTPDDNPGTSNTFYFGDDYVRDSNNDGKVDGLKFLYNGVQFIYTAEDGMNIAALESSYSLPETGNELSYDPASFSENNFDSDPDGTWTLPNAIEALREGPPTLNMVRVIDAYSALTDGNDQHIVTFFQKLRISDPYLINRFFLYYEKNSDNKALKYNLGKEVFSEPFKMSPESAIYFFPDFSLDGFRIKQGTLIPYTTAQILNQHIQKLLENSNVAKISWDDTFHGHPLFLNNSSKTNPKKAVTVEEYFRDMDLVLYHTREGEENWDPKTSPPRSFCGSPDGNIFVVEGDQGYQQLPEGTAYGRDVKYEGKKGYEYKPDGLKVSAEGITGEVEVQFYFTQTTEGRFKLPSGEAYDFYLVFSN